MHAPGEAVKQLMCWRSSVASNAVKSERKAERGDGELKRSRRRRMSERGRGRDQGNCREEELPLLPAEAVVNGASFSCHLHNMEMEKKDAVQPLKWTCNMSPAIMQLSGLQMVSTLQSRSCHR